MAKTKLKFTHLHLHTEYSLLDGMIKIKDLMPRIKELGMDSVALTDHGVMYGIVQFYKEALANDIKPILGVEAYLTEDYLKRKIKKKVDDGDDKMYYHLTLLAKNIEGYKNLLKLVTIANTDGFYYKPRIDKKLLKQYSKGIIAMSGCYGGEIPQTLIKYKKNPDLAVKKASEVVVSYVDIFGDDFYIEIQRGTSGNIERYVDPLLIKLAKVTGRKLVATNDSHYLVKEDAPIERILWAVNTGKTLDDPTLMTPPTEELYVKSPQEMIDMFKDIPEAIKTTQEIVEKVEDFKITYDRIQPKYLDLPKGVTAKEFLRKQVFNGAKERYGKITDKIKQRIDYELSIIDQKGYNDYFLIVSDYVRWAKRQGIIVGPGRGSGAGSVVAYCLHITDIDPFWWGLEFERFLNPQRPSPPDFDIDFQDDRRDEVIKYIENKYGHDKVAAICAIGRMDTKAAIHDVSRAMGISLEMADKVAKLIPVKRGKPMPILEAVDTVPELKKIVNSDSKVAQMIKAVSRIKKVARHVSVHACGYVITPKPLYNYIPLRIAPQNKDLIITQVEGKPLEKMGLMKYDFLGLRTLTILKNVLEVIKQQHGIEIDLSKVNLEDKKTYKLFQQARTEGVFQFESQGMRSYLKELKPERIQDINFMCAAYRPGPMKYIPDYIERKHGRQETKFLHPDLKPILEETYGIAVYQEQVLKIAVVMAGYTVGEADILRRAIGKKEKETLLKEKDRLINGMLQKGYSKEVAQKIWEYMLPFAEYGFNKSHSACYAVIAYRTAYLKAHHPVEFMTGMMQTDYKRPDRLEKDLQVAISMNIKVLPPDINKSVEEFSIEEHNDRLEQFWLDENFQTILSEEVAQGREPYLGKIRYGFGGIKGVSSKAISAILEERKKGEFKHLDDFLNRVDLKEVDRKSLELLTKAGAFDKWGERNAILSVLGQLYDKYKTAQTRKHAAQMSLLGVVDSDKDNLVQATILPDVEPASLIEILNWEKDLFGVYLSSHPLLQLKSFFKAKGVLSIRESIVQFSQGKKNGLAIGVQVAKFKKYKTKNGDLMAFVDVEDYSSVGLKYEYSVIMFPRVYKRFAETVLVDIDPKGKIFIFKGNLDHKLDKYSFIVDDFKLVDFEKAKATQYEEKSDNVSVSSNIANIAKNTNKNGNKIANASDKDKENSINNVYAVGLVLKANLGKDKLKELKEYLDNHTGNLKLVLLLPNKKKVVYKKGLQASNSVIDYLKRFGKVVIKRKG